GTQAHIDCKDWIVDQLKLAGAQTSVQTFKSTFFGKTGAESFNIIGSYNDKAQNRILLAAHWDTRAIADKDPDAEKQKNAIDGADDGASGLGVLLEVARWVHATTPNIGVDIIFFDAEDQGEDEVGWCQGSNYWSNYPHKPGYR